MSSIEILKRVALRLGPLNASVAFVGGAVTEILISDPAAPPSRPTDDVDAIVGVVTHPEYYELHERLRSLGFTEDATEDAPACRWIVDGIKVDMMPTSDVLLGFSNHWYSEALENAIAYIAEGTAIRVVTAPYFVATKLEAYKGRGKGDLRASHDIEDIVAVVDGRWELVDECAASGEGLRGYIRIEMTTLLATPGFAEAVAGHLPGDSASQDRVPIVLARLRALASI